MSTARWILEHDEAWWQDDGSFSCPLGQLTKAEVEQAVARFRAFDIDKDGVVSYEDFNTAMIRHNPALAHPSQTIHLRHMFRAADINGSGTIELTRWVLMRLRSKLQQESTQPERAAKVSTLPSTGNTASASPSPSASLRVDQESLGLRDHEACAATSNSSPHSPPGHPAPRPPASWAEPHDYRREAAALRIGAVARGHSTRKQHTVGP